MVAAEAAPCGRGSLENHLMQRQSSQSRVTLVSDRARSGCALELEVAGGTFEPDTCAFEVISAGPQCDDMAGCRGDYAMSLKNTRAGADDISSIVLFNIPGLETGTYKVDPSLGAKDFKGELIDRGAVSRHLLQGELTLDQRGDQMHVIFDVRFANDISVRGSGLMALMRLNAP